tara:strand:+ start:204 stop:647 length:444 start_codon:yes stop_codon:yes gene_type:complete
MFNFTILSVGKIKNASTSELSKEYQKRLKLIGRLDVIEISDGTIHSEGQRFLEILNRRKQAQIFVLSEEGNLFTSNNFSKKLNNLQGQQAIFVIGGAYGLDPKVKARADIILSLSPMTFNHEIAQMILTEQLYRGVSIFCGRKYHHG